MMEVIGSVAYNVKENTFVPIGIDNVRCMNTIEDVSDAVNELQEAVFYHPEQIEENIVRSKKIKEQKALKARQEFNKLFRGLVEHVKFSGDVCIIYWNDGLITKSRWARDEPYDPEKAILAAMARKLYGGSGLYCEVLEKYAEDGWEHYYNNILPREVEEINKEDFFEEFKW